jgi:hypothetical protein
VWSHEPELWAPELARIHSLSATTLGDHSLLACMKPSGNSKAHPSATDRQTNKQKPCNQESSRAMEVCRSLRHRRL